MCEGGWSVVRVLGGSCGGRLQMGFRRCAVSVVVLSWWFVFSGEAKGLAALCDWKVANTNQGFSAFHHVYGKKM